MTGLWVAIGIACFTPGDFQKGKTMQYQCFSSVSQFGAYESESSCILDNDKRFATFKCVEAHLIIKGVKR